MLHFISKIKSSIAFNLLKAQFYLVFVNKYILGYIDIILPNPYFVYIGSFVPKTQPNK